MATESDLRDLLRGPDPEGPAIDVDAVLRRARTRRRPRLIAAQAVGSFALVGVLGVTAFVALPRPMEASMVTMESAEDSDTGGAEYQSSPLVDPTQDLKRAGECGDAPLVLPMMGWSVELSATSPDSSTLIVPMTLRAEGIPVSGTAVATAILVVVDDIVVGHAFPEASSGPVDLQPGESVSWEAVGGYVACDGYAPTLPTGAFQIIVDVQFLHGGDEGNAEPIHSPLVTVEASAS